MAEDRVVITGTGIVCALGKTPKEVWSALVTGRTGIGPIEGFDAGGFACTSAAQVRDLNVTELGVHPRDARIMDTPSYSVDEIDSRCLSPGGSRQDVDPERRDRFLRGHGNGRL